MSGCWQQGTIRGSHGSAQIRGRVVKLGGSLLTRPTWPADIASLLAALHDQADGGPAPVIVVGGGPVVDGLRAVDHAAPRPPALMHDLAIEAMRLTGRIVAEALRLPTIATIEADPTGPAILDVGTWLATTGAGSRVSHGWDATSDSIAAVVAETIGRELVLVKSVPPPCPNQDLAALAAAGWVDDCFPSAAALLSQIAWASPALANATVQEREQRTRQ
jgi:aspartokinase-like uncharacterized kinase